MNITFVRHGISEANVCKFLKNKNPNGIKYYDAKLHHYGIKQIYFLKNIIKNIINKFYGKQPYLIFCSSLIRTIKTASLIHNDQKIYVNPILNELGNEDENNGHGYKFTKKKVNNKNVIFPKKLTINMDTHKYKLDKKYKCWQTKTNSIIYNNNYDERMNDFIIFLKKMHDDNNDNIVIYTHYVYIIKFLELYNIDCNSLQNSQLINFGLILNLGILNLKYDVANEKIQLNMMINFPSNKIISKNINKNTILFTSFKNNKCVKQYFITKKIKISSHKFKNK